ncbi:MAG TPA: aldose 1-epimerase [Thermoanaerobaculia bacterium]|nr:aldose 1-epimerase [Thermoanaerobaculia bacterium]
MPEPNSTTIGGQPVVTLERPQPADASRPAFLKARILPGRGMTTLQITAHLPGRGATDLLDSPSLAAAREILDGETGDFVGNASYLLGGAILIPYANRIRGTLSPDRKTVEADILGRRVRLPANSGGRRPGAEQYAMHGLILASPMDEIRRKTTEEEDRVDATLHAGDFGHGWPSATDLSFENVLRSDSFTLTVTATNAGAERLPLGIGWHPYFLLPSGQREQGRLHLPARRRTVVNDYDEVLPTGEVLPVAGTPYDFSQAGGKPLGNLFLDDCFVDLETRDGQAVAEVIDPAASYGLRILGTSPPIRALQVYGPPERKIAVVEPQFNWADPFGPQWGRDVDTGMVILEPGESVTYSARLELFTP